MNRNHRHRWVRGSFLVAVAALASAALLAGSASADLSAYVMTELNTQDSHGYRGGVALGINEGGVATGYLYGAVYEAVSWNSAGEFTLLESPPVKYESHAYAINNRGQIAGFNRFGPGPPVQQAVVWETDGTPTALSAYGGTGYGCCIAYAMNNHGQAVGVSGGHAIMWDRGELTDLGTGWTPRDINDRGQIVGGNVLWEKGETTTLAFDAVGINDRGQVVGENYLWENGEITTLEGFSAAGINNRGQIVGVDSSGQPALWENGEITPLPTYGSATGLEQASAINDRGVIVGYVQRTTPYVRVPVVWTLTVE